jgi:Na+(H+)/acetate symporter ActP
VITWLIWGAEVFAAPLLAAAVSALFLVSSPRLQSRPRRLLASAHGATIAVLYLAAWTVLLTGHSGRRLGVPFEGLLLIPLFLIVASFFLYQGRRAMHWLQVVNVACLMWTGLAGGMLITGESP